MEENSIHYSFASLGISSGFGSQFRVSVATSGDGDVQAGPQFMHNIADQLASDSPWQALPISSLQYILQASSGNCYPNTPLAIAYWDFAEMERSPAEDGDIWSFERGR